MHCNTLQHDSSGTILIHKYIYIHIYIHIHIHGYIDIDIDIDIDIYVYIFIYIYIYVYKYVYIYIYVYIYMHIHIPINIYIHICVYTYGRNSLLSVIVCVDRTKIFSRDTQKKKFHFTANTKYAISFKKFQPPPFVDLLPNPKATYNLNSCANISTTASFRTPETSCCDHSKHSQFTEFTAYTDCRADF